MEKLAERLESAADALTTVDRSLAAHASTPGAFGAQDEGTPGRLGRDLHNRWLEVLAARWAREKLHDEVFGAFRSLGDR